MAQEPELETDQGVVDVVVEFGHEGLGPSGAESLAELSDSLCRNSAIRAHYVLEGASRASDTVTPSWPT